MAQRLTKQAIDKLAPGEKDYFIWDSDLIGFGIKVSRGGRKSYVCKFRLGHGRTAATRRMTIGAHGSPWTPEQARNRAKELLGQVANGHDPARERRDTNRAMTVQQLCDQYLKHGVATKKDSTIKTDIGRIKRHIIPLLGKMKLRDVNRSTIQRFMKDVADGKTATDLKTGPRGRSIVKGGKGTASRTVGLLGGIFSFAVDAGLIEVSPVQGVKRYPDSRGERFLTNEEFVRLGQSLERAEADGVNLMAIAIIKLLIFTGARRGEIEQLTWKEIDLEQGYLMLKTSKTGQKMIPLNVPALKIIKVIPHQGQSDWVFASASGGGHYTGTPKVWRKIREQAGLPDLRIHDLRHSFASVAISSGTSLALIGGILGHKSSNTTQRYAHIHEDPLMQASQRIGEEISRVIDMKSDDGTSD